MPKKPVVQTQFLVFTLFGDYILPRGGEAWTRNLLDLLNLLDVNDQAARLVLSRMSRKGWVKATRIGRYSRYRLTTKGKALLAEGGQRIFEPRLAQWDGRWHLVVYSMPESRRKQRQQLRERLRWLGYGRLAPGTWISPHARRPEVEALVDELTVRPFVQFFSARHVGFTNDRAIVEQCWDLDTLNQRYTDFITRHAPEYKEYRATLSSHDGLECSDCFVRRFWITHEYQPFPLLDPNLPVALLPDGWLGDQAVQLFREYRDLLAPHANAFVDTTLSRTPSGVRKS